MRPSVSALDRGSVRVHGASGRRRSRLAVSPFAVFGCLVAHRRLVLELVRRDVHSRYRGSLLGLLWALLSPLLMLAVFTLVFTTIFESRWDVALDRRGHFSLLLFAGLVVFWQFADTVNRAPTLMLENVSYVKRVVFPLEILPWVVTLSVGFHTLLNFVVLLCAYGYFLGAPPATALWAPLIFVPLLLMGLGLCWGLASLGVFLRDMKQIVPVIVTLLMFLCPIFYPLSAVPDWFRLYVHINPLASVISELRTVLFFAEPPDWVLLAEATAVCWVIAWLGLAWFQRTRRAFADVL